MFSQRFKTTFKQKCSNLRPFLSTIVFHKDSESLKILDIWLLEVGAKKTFKMYLKSEQTHRHTERQTFWLIESIGPEGQCFENGGPIIFSKSDLADRVIFTSES